MIRFSIYTFYTSASFRLLISMLQEPKSTAMLALATSVSGIIHHNHSLYCHCMPWKAHHLRVRYFILRFTFCCFCGGKCASLGKLSAILDVLDGLLRRMASGAVLRRAKEPERMPYLRLGMSSGLRVLDAIRVESNEGENGPALYADSRDVYTILGISCIH